MFNQYFYKQFSGPSCYDTNIDFTNDSTFDIDLSDSRIKPLLDNLDINKAQGPDAVSGAVLKNCSKTLAYPLSILFNLSYNTGYIPQEWKLANVVPVHKKDDKNKVTNYRPISLTSLVLKVFERILYDELLTRTIDKIDTRQHGFLRNRSCNSNLLLFTESIVRSLHEKIGTDVIYFDFAKAFDTVSHDLILNKLKTQYNIDGTLLKFFTEYLCSRKQRVILDNVISECVDVLSGVPQGSILGPLLFLLFINDIYTNIDKDTNIALFADDTKIWRDINSEADCEILQFNKKFTLSQNGSGIFSILLPMLASTIIPALIKKGKGNNLNFIETKLKYPELFKRKNYPLSNIFINNLLKDNKNFIGCFSTDQIKSIENNKSIIINLQNNEPGSHWIASKIVNNTIFVFDSFGVGYLPIRIFKVYKDYKIITNIYRIQDISSNLCGLFCVLFILYDIESKNDFIKFLILFNSNDFLKNELI